MLTVITRYFFYVIFGLAGVFLYFLPIVFVEGAEFLFSPQSGSFSAGEEFSVKVIINPQGESVNVADGVINFDGTMLSATGISKGGSVFSLWTSEPKISNTNGTVVFSGGTPSVFSTQSTILTITFKGLKTGNTVVSFASGSILAADGKGTDVFTGGTSGNFTIKEGNSIPPPSTLPPQSSPRILPSRPIGGAVPTLPLIVSSTHEESSNWYSTSTAQFSWDVPFNVTGVRLLVSQEEDATPRVVYAPPISERSIKDLEDGVWYFYVQLRNDFGWGEAGQKKIQIDTTPPSEFTIELLDQGIHSDVPKLFFEAEDVLSGINYYEVVIGDTISDTVYPKDILGSAYIVPPQSGGQKLVTVKAYDKAGNVREVASEILVPQVIKQIANEEDEALKEPASLVTLEWILTIFFVFTTGALAATHIYSRKQLRRERTVILQEALEIREKNDKIFSAIREELEDQVNALDRKPQLTPAERELLEKMKEVLDISEELIDTEIEDLKKMIRNNQR